MLRIIQTVCVFPFLVSSGENADSSARGSGPEHVSGAAKLSSAPFTGLFPQQGSCRGGGQGLKTPYQQRASHKTDVFLIISRTYMPDS